MSNLKLYIQPTGDWLDVDLSIKKPSFKRAGNGHLYWLNLENVRSLKWQDQFF